MTNIPVDDGRYHVAPRSSTPTQAAVEGILLAVAAIACLLLILL